MKIFSLLEQAALPRIARFAILGSVLMQVILAPDAARSEECVYPAYNCAITPPEGWVSFKPASPQPGLIVSFRKPDNTAVLYLLINEREKFPKGLCIDSKFVSEFERGIEASGGSKRISGKFIEIAGVTGYERLGCILLKGKQLFFITRVLPANGTTLHLDVMGYDKAVGDDPEICKAVASFRFIKPPPVVAQSRSSDIAGAAFRTGKFTAKLFLSVLSIIGIIVGIIYGTRRKPSPKKSIPPPLPPPPLPPSN